MENLNDKKNKNNDNIHQKSRFNSDMISNLFLQLRDNKYDKMLKKKNKIKYIKDNSLKTRNFTKLIIKENFRDTIMDEIGYVYNESNKEKIRNNTIKDELFYKKKKIYEQLNREYFPFYKFNDYMNKTKKIKNKKRNLTDYYILETINKNKTEINDYNEHMIPTTNHYQIVELKGIKNQTYGIRYDNKPNYFSFHNISLSKFSIILIII